MNSQQILSWLIKDTEENSKDYYSNYYPYDEKYELEDILFELNNRRDMKLPSDFTYTLKRGENEVVKCLREIFKNNVTFISAVLNQIFPDKYLFYRVSMLENEIFTGFKFFSDMIEDLCYGAEIRSNSTPLSFKFAFDKIGRGAISFDNYLKLNEALFSFASLIWPDLTDPKTIQQRMHYFLYQGLSNLFLDKDNYNRYWVMATGGAYFDELDDNSKVVWSGRKEMKEGDLVFMYRQSPRKAITDLYRVYLDPFFDPFAAWDGFWVELEKITSVSDITMANMKQDEILSQWNVVRCHSQGVTTAIVPHFIYNCLLEKIGSDLLIKYNLTPEPQAGIGIIGEVTSETEFEEKFIEPLLKHWGFKYKKQALCDFRVGGQQHSCRVDFLVVDEKGDLTLIENKLSIKNDKELHNASSQAKSYSLQLGFNSYIVASPQGFWIYKLNRNEEILVESIMLDELDDKGAQIRDLILKLRNN